MAENNVVFTNNTTKQLYPKEQHFWSGLPLTAAGRIPPGSSAQGKQLTTSEGSLKFATVYVDSEKELPTTRKFITAFDIAAFQKYGPYGSDLPINYSMILGQDESIKEVIVRNGFIVDAIGFVVADKNGSTSTKIFGGNGGHENRIPLQKDEYITQISGTYGKYAHSNSGSVVATLIIHTNLKPSGYGPYGRGELVQNPRTFASNTSDSIIGFFGRYSNYLESVGLYDRASVVIKEFGPYGTQSPKNYSMRLGQGESIKEIIVRHGFIVDAIGFVVVDDKTGRISTKIFGGSNGSETKIPLKSDEYITQISGTYGKYQHTNSDNNVGKLTIHTNLNPGGYGPYGRGERVQNPRNFISPSSPVAGFFGRHDNYLQSIGVYLSTSAPSKAYAESGPVGPIDWKMVEVKLGQSQPSVVYDGGKVVAAVFGDGDAGVVYNETY
ncbi:agglutinin-like [Silene latifolia]|uniref:agglutinin-like n=1 Tax=Silene latifolia TaxID=37657 RepID=UPI003D788B83